MKGAVRRHDCPLSDVQITYAPRHNMLPLHRDGRLVYVQSLEGYAARRISELTRKYSNISPRIRLATRAELDGFLIRHAGHALAVPAADGLKNRLPHLSAAPLPRPSRNHWRLAWQAMALACAFVIAPLTLIQICGAFLAIWFLLFTCLRLAGSFAPRPRIRRLARLPDDQLPIYSIVVALYREATSVAPLIRSLETLDYPGIMAQTPQAIWTVVA
ncbi:MAG: hypothetical protein EKK40_07585 [Bradyrhizobiaceae bacterium]|nr:MAG: hypothetical protein EKK40_07585 [Bradyrhizobiaceae bacterium]